MTPWHQLLSTALVGTERRPLAPEVVPAVRTAVGVDPSRPHDELTVLAAAGALGTYRRTGLRLEHAHARAVPEPSPPDDRPDASPMAVQLLELVLRGPITVTGGSAELARHWLERAAQVGVRPPPGLLPDLLALGTRIPQVRAAVQAAGGPRLAWLARWEPAWAWATGDDAVGVSDLAEAWRTGERATRFALLRALRATRPERAALLVGETWRGEKAADRAEIVGILRTRLGPEDEPFLEEALDDRSKAVRAAAAKTLSGLPTSRLAARMVERLRPLVGTPSGTRRRSTLEVRPPEQVDEAGRRDGITDAGAPAQMGRRHWWLVQIVGAVPLDAWAGLVRRPAAELPAELPRLASPELLLGLSIAAARQHDVLWSRALLTHRADPPLLAVLPPEMARPVLEQLIGQGHVTDPSVPGLLAAVPGPWTVPLTHAVIERLRAVKNKVALEQGVGALARAGHPVALPELETWIDSSKPGDRWLLRAAAHHLTIRASIDQELT